ncbi:MAG: hypothetical protein KDK36_00445 [Leptospiraceae bacterium]|nr:hypothetical protein [Leptospiraceae bacterium]
MNRFLLYLFSLSIFSFPLLAHETFIINEKLESHNLKSQLRLIEDKEGNFNFEDVINIPDESWSKTNKDPSFGYTNSTHWAKVSIKSIKENLFYLEISYPHLDFIDLYYYNQEGNLIQKKTGEYLPFDSRDLKYKNFIFLIK